MKKTTVGKAIVSVALCFSYSMADDIAFTEETAAAYLKLTPPVNVLFYGMYADGGSIGISLADTSGKEFHVFEDHSMANAIIADTNLPESVRMPHKDRPYTAGRIFIGEGAPTKDKKITPIEEGKRIKAAVECLALAWFDREITPEEQALFTGFFRQKSRGDNPNRTVLMNKIVPPRKEGETDEERRAFSDAYMKNALRFNAAFYVAGQLKGMAPPRKKLVPSNPEP